MMSARTAVSPAIGIFDGVQWGAHFCYWYESHRDLTDILSAYYRQGLESNALCLWLSDVELGQQVMAALGERIPDLGQYRQKKQIDAMSHVEWYLREGMLSVAAAVEHASAALDQAKGLGFDGIWVAGDLSWLDKREWQTLVKHEGTVCRSIHGAPAVALCARSTSGLSIPEALEMSRVHRAVITKREGKWELIGDLEQRKAEQSLREADRTYEHLFDSTLDGIEVIDAKSGRILIANPAAARIFGFESPSQMVGVDPLGFLPPEDRERVANLMADSMFQRDLHEVMELRAFRKDGSQIWISARGVRTRYQGELAGLVSFRDVTDQKAAEEALRESRRDLQAVFDSARDGMAVFDGAGRLLKVNRRILEVGGYSAVDLVGKTFDQLGMFGAHDIAKIATISIPVLSGADAPPMELEATMKSGQRLTLEVRVSPLKKNGDVVGAIAVLRDISERKRAVEQIQASEQRNRLLVENASEGILVIQDGAVRFANRTSLEIVERLGYALQEVQAWPLVDFVHPEDRRIFREARRILVSGKKAENVHRFRALGKAGQIRWIELNAIRLTWDGKPAILAFLNDVTQRKQAEDAVIQSEKRYRLLAENVTDVIWVTDVNLRPIYVSPSIERLVGLGAGEAVFGVLEDALSAPSAGKVREVLAKLMSAGQDDRGSYGTQYPVELELLRRDGSTVWVDTTVTTIRDQEGHPVQFLGVLRDISQRKQAEEQLQESFRKLSKTLEGTIQAIRSMVDTRDRYTAGHQQRVTELACAIAEAMNLKSEQIQAVHVAGLLHDVGKILLPTEILTKPGKLNEIEFAMVRTHPRAGYDILGSIEFPWPIAKMVLQHHERINGSGYPEGVRGEDILLEARIIAVADVVEAMSSHRPYRPALGLDKALDEIVKNSGILYDPLVADACVRVFGEKGFTFKAEAIAEPY